MTPTPLHQHTPRPRGFTLLELLVVITIMSILLGLIAGVSHSATQAVALSTTSDNLFNKLVEIQQLGIAKNKEVEVRLYRYEDEDSGVEEVRGLGFFEEVVDENGVAILSVDTPFVLADHHVISSGTDNGSPLSTLIDEGNTTRGLISSSGAASDPPLFGPADDAPYTAFRLHPNGSTSLNPTSSNSDHWHLTVVRQVPGSPTTGQTEAPKNYYTIRIDPYTGRLEKWRP